MPLMATGNYFDLMVDAVKALAKLATAHHRMAEVNEQMLKIAKENLEVQKQLAYISAETKASLDRMNDPQAGWSNTPEGKLV